MLATRPVGQVVVERNVTQKRAWSPRSRLLEISGNTKFSQSLVDFWKGADCLVRGLAGPGEEPRTFYELASGEDAGRVFAAVKPKLAVAYH